MTPETQSTLATIALFALAVFAAGVLIVGVWK